MDKPSVRERSDTSGREMEKRERDRYGRETRGSDAVTCCRRVRHSGCVGRATAATALLLCGLFGESFHVGATTAAFLSATTGSLGGGASPLAPSPDACCQCTPDDNGHFRRSNSIASSSAANYATRDINIFSARRSRKGGYQQLHSRASRRSAAFSMRLPVDGDSSSSSAAPRQGDRSPALLRPRVQLDPPDTVGAIRTDSAVPTAAAAGAGTSRLDFLRQTSAAAALVGAAVTSGLFVPTRPASAAFGTGLLTPEAEVAAAAAATERMVWLDEDSGTVSSRLSQADETYGQGFVAYLARFLLNYDEGCREYFKGKLDCALPRRDGSHIWEEFRVRLVLISLSALVSSWVNQSLRTRVSLHP